MNLNVFCSIALGLSVFLIVLAIGTGIAMHRAELKNTGIDGNRRVLTPFQVFILCFFFAAVTVFLPIYYVQYLTAETGVLKALKAFLLSVQNALRLFTLNGEFDNVRDFLGDPSINAVLAECYSVYAAAIFVAAPLLTAGFVLSFFRDASAMLRYSLRPCRELYVMSELNDRSLTFAKNILGQGKRGCIVIFTDVFEKGEEKNHERILTARHMGAICVKRDVTDLGLKYARKCKRKVYFIGINEDENVGQALKLITRHRDDRRYKNKAPEFYVFATTAESEALLDSTDNGDMKVRRINENYNLALSEMLTHPIFENAIAEGGKKAIRIAIVGLGGYGKELLKTICCLGQMPGYTVELHVFDKEGAEERLKASAPGLMTLNEHPEMGEAEYSIVFHPSADVKSVSFIQEFSSVDHYTGVYVMLGEDELNIETAMRLRTALRRKDRKDVVPIYAVVFDPVKADIMARGGLKSMDNEGYGICCIGSLQSSYTLENIEQSKLEGKAEELHLKWADTATQKAKARKKFDQYEYYRRSSMMQAVYRDLREGLGFRRGDENTPEGKAYNDVLRRYEHRRWSTYLLGEGYIKDEASEGREKDQIAKTHRLLIPFDKLPEAERMKDDF